MLSEKSLSFMVSQLSSIGQRVMSGVSDAVVNIAVAIMLLFFMLYEGRKMESYVTVLLPFEEENKREVLEKIQLMVRSNAIGIPLLAVIQGFISLGGYLLCGAPNPILTAFLTAFASVIPIVGTAIIWIPVTIYFFLIGDWVNGLILLGYGGIIISQCDNLIRFILQKKDGQHPSADYHLRCGGGTSDFRVYGNHLSVRCWYPLFLLFIEMFRDEYLLNDASDEGVSK